MSIFSNLRIRPSAGDVPSGCSQFGTVMTKAVMKIRVQVPVWTHVSLLLGKSLGVEP